MKKFELLFDSGYLLFDVIAAIIFFIHADDSIVFLLYGIMVLLLGIGDAFHLIPRMRKIIKGEEAKTEFYLGLGTQITSITMTIFYVILYYIWKALFGIHVSFAYPLIIWATAIIRIILCLLPQNNWYHYEGNPKWALYRNIPFVFTGLSLYLLFIFSANSYGYHMNMMSIAIAISFICYLVVVLYAKKYPKVGMLMIPKTCAYIWMIAMGLNLIGKIH